jgi:signal transduction histidine kinase
MKVKRFISRIPYWAYLLVILSIVTNTFYFIYKQQEGIDCQSNHHENGNCVIDYVTPGGAAEKAGIKPGDILVTIDSIEVHEWSSIYRGDKAGDTCYYGIIRDGRKIELPVVFSSSLEFNFGFILTIYIILILLSVGGLFLLYKKPHDVAVRLFFIFLQFFVVTQNANYITLREPFAIASTFIFLLSSCLVGPLLIHFHLLFPRPAKIYKRFGKWKMVFYVVGIFVTLWWFLAYRNMVMNELEIYTLRIITRFSLLWMISTYFLAVAIVIFQFISIKETFSRNQLRLVIIGSFFGIYTAIPIVFFDGWIQQIQAKYPYIIFNLQGIGSLIMIGCILIAIFRYRIWDIEIFFRKTLLYLGATLIIILSYLFLILLINQLAINETNLTRFIVLAVSVIFFLFSRDKLQRLIDRIFHRESYDSATVVTKFEEKLAGIYRADELKIKIAQGLDEIFHFKSFMLNLKNSNQKYQHVYAIGLDKLKFDEEFEAVAEFEKKLRKTKVFSSGELEQKLAVAEAANAELIVPLVKEDQPFGFLICGQKKSEKTYSMQDIRVLTLIAKRVIALFQTATLYQKDLDRQLMLERERARISQDMHDDVGASLTRISILSDLAKSKNEVTDETKQWLGQISDTSRDVMEEMSQIIWALNPKNDTLEGLIAYIRRFAYEYLELTNINCTFDLPEILPNKPLTVEVRRNVYLVVRESLHNVVKHSGAAKVWISMKMNEHGFKIDLKDDGAGFDPGNLEFPGNGLINMRKRMKDIGGDFKITSALGKGTEIEIVI